MAWTVTRTGNIINLVPDGATDFVYSSHFPNNPEGLKILEIQLVFTAANDKWVIRDGGLTGPVMFEYLTLTGESVAKQFHGGLFKPYVEHDNQVYPAVTSSKIIIQVV